MKKRLIVPLLVLILAVFALSAASASPNFGFTNKQWAKMAHDCFTSPAARERALNLRSDPGAVSDLRLILATNYSTKAMRVAAGQTPTTFAYSYSAIRSALVETVVDWYPDCGEFPRTK